MKSLEKFLVTEKETIKSSLKKLNDNAEGVLLLVDEKGRLERTITDGDMRRALLQGATLSDPIGVLPPLKPTTVPVDTPEDEVLQLMVKAGLNHIPVVAENGMPVEIRLRKAVDQRILLSTPHLGSSEMQYVTEAFESNWIAPIGPNVDGFEKEFAEYLGVGQAAAVSSGTAALHLALRILEVGHGDTVFVPSFTFVASVNPVLYQAAYPVFIDSDPETWNMSAVALQKAFRSAKSEGRLPKAVIVVSLYGQSADMDTLLDICDEYKVPIIEDAAESLGATYKNKASGTLGKIGCYSFNGNKIITTSGGGMLVSDDEEIVERAKFLSTQAKEAADWYEHKELGYNYRMSNILAGIGRGQLKVLNQRINARRAIFERYQNRLGELEGIHWMPEASFGSCTRWLTAALLEHQRDSVGPKLLIKNLADTGIEARHVWKPMHTQVLFEDSKYFTHYDDESFADYAFAHGVCLPSGSNMTEEQQARIIEAIKVIFRNAA